MRDRFGELEAPSLHPGNPQQGCDPIDRPGPGFCILDYCGMLGLDEEFYGDEFSYIHEHLAALMNASGEVI